MGEASGFFVCFPLRQVVACLNASMSRLLPGKCAAFLGLAGLSSPGRRRGLGLQNLTCGCLESNPLPPFFINFGV